MSTELEVLKQNVDRFILDVLTDFENVLQAPEPQKLPQVTVDALRQLVNDFGTSEYGFNLAIEWFVEKCCTLIADILPEILADFMPRHAVFAIRSEDTDVAFVAYYALSLIYKKEDRQEALKSLIGEKYSFFPQLYPLAFEVRSRYYKRANEYANALEADEMAIEYLKAQDITNYALCISYASTVCRMYEQGYDVEPYQRENAGNYIDNAIAYNPRYPKYHFLKGKLIFYSGLTVRNLQTFQQICSEALECIKRARNLQMEQHGAHFEAALEEYRRLRTLIDQESKKRSVQSLPFQPCSERELRERIQKVLAAETKSECRPPNPNLQPGQKYLFISYCHSDFRSVYCDLWTLYANKVPFQYDGGIPKGARWDEEARKYINRAECLGVLFFLSENTLLSEPVETECRLTAEAQQSGKRWYSVNLEGETTPSEILMNSIIHHGVEHCIASKVDTDRISTFLTIFSDQILFLGKSTQLGPGGQAHIPELLHSLRQTFPGLEFPDPAVPAVSTI